MAFKKKQIKKTNNILLILGIFFIFIITYLGFYTVQVVDSIFWESKYVAWSWIVKVDEETWEKTFKKEITVLIVWIWWAENDAPELTDTIILAKVNKDKKTVSLLSIQRDLYVSYTDKDWVWKLNSVYAHYYYKNNFNESLAMKKLQEKITDITWEEIDYFVNIDFAWFRKIIDTLWGIEIDVKNSFVDKTYPAPNWWYQTVSFTSWLQTMDWDKALKYARSRHSTSDYDRSLRQQQVIQAVKDKLTSSETMDVARLTELYNVLKENLTTDISLNDAISIAIDMWVLKENFSFSSSNFNDSCFSINSVCEKWWILYTPDRSYFWGLWVSLVRWTTSTTLSKYDLSRKYSQIVLNYPLISSEWYEINIFNGSRVSWASAFVNELKKYWFVFTERDFVSNAPETYETSVIYYNWIWENSDTIQALKSMFKWEVIKISEPKYSKEKAKIEIIIWKDYISDKTIFNF